MPVRDLVEVILSATGKDAGRVQDVLHRGAVVQGGSRFRWQGIDAVAEDLASLLATFPDPDPKRLFRAERCIGAKLRAGLHVVELPKQIAAEKRLFRHRSFWDALMEAAERGPVEYTDYSYRLRGDEYRMKVSSAELIRLREAAALLRYSGLAAQVIRVDFDCLELVVQFP
jgi:hypothetical protein